jgi:hypothetical protein
MFYEQDEYEILTPAGFKNFKGVQSVKKFGKITLDLYDGKHVECSPLHQFLTESGWKKAIDLTFDDKIKTKDEYISLFNIECEEGEFEFFDVVGVEGYQFYSNDIVSHNCEFLGSTNTLISGSKLAQMAYVEPIAKHELLDIYEYPIKGDEDETKSDHIYAMTVDPSEGRNMDGSSFSVFDVSSIPYKQVAKYNSSSISPVLFPTVIYNTAKLYNNAYVLVEINNTPQIADTLHQDLEYENVVKIETGNKKAQAMGTGFGRGIQLGIKMSAQVKRIGCSNLKTLIEHDKLIINDFDTISQLTTFVSRLNTFKAEEGSNDDIVMTLVMFAWMSTQQYFKEIVNHDLRKQMQLEMLNQSDEEMPSFGIFNDGNDQNYIVEDGDVWLSREEDAFFRA